MTANGELEPFEVHPDAPITPRSEWQGTNAQRFAIAGALFAQGADGEARPVQDEDLATFGFGDGLRALTHELTFGSNQTFGSEEAILEEAATLRRLSDSWIDGEAGGVPGPTSIQGI